jgi:hypothetical protein
MAASHATMLVNRPSIPPLWREEPPLWRNDLSPCSLHPVLWQCSPPS